MSEAKTQSKLSESFARLVENRRRHGVANPTDKVGLVYADQVPISGSVHLSTGRTIDREEINKRFSKVK